MEGGREFVGNVAESANARVIVCTSDCTEDDVLASIQAGAVGFLRKDTLTPESLGAAVRAAGQRHRRRRARPARQPPALADAGRRSRAATRTRA